MKRHFVIRLLCVLLVCLSIVTAGCSRFRILTNSTTGWTTSTTTGTAKPTTVPQATAPKTTTAVVTTPERTTAATAAPTAPAVSFDVAVRQLLVSGLDAGSRQVDLTPAVMLFFISEALTPATLDRVQDQYRLLLDDRPDYYYLDGSNTLRYEIQASASGPRLSGLTMEIGTRSPYDTWTSAAMVTARQTLLDKADEIAAMAAGKPAWEQMRVIHDELVRRVVYDTTYNQDTNHAAGALLGGRTLCQGYAQAFQLIGQRLGLSVRMISGTANGISHAWNLVVLDGKTYHIDVTFDDPVSNRDITPVVFHSHFLRSDAVMRATHQWTASAYTACPEDGAQYYRLNGLTAATRAVLKQRVTAHFAALNLNDAVNDTFEILYTGPDVPTGAELETLFLAALGDAGLSRSYSYSSAMEKNAAQLVLFAP